MFTVFIFESQVLYSLRVLTQKSFFRILFYTPKGPPKYISKNDSKIVSALSPTIARSRLLPLIGFPLWLPPSLRTSWFLLALYPCSQQFSEFPKSTRAWIRGYEKLRGTQRKAEKAGAKEEEGRSAQW